MFPHYSGDSPGLKQILSLFIKKANTSRDSEKNVSLRAPAPLKNTKEEALSGYTVLSANGSNFQVLTLSGLDRSLRRGTDPKELDRLA